MNDAVMTSQQIKQLDDNTTLTKEIHSAIVGNPTMRQPGIVGQLKEVSETVVVHGRRLDEVDKKFIRYTGIAGGLMIALELVKLFVETQHK